MQDLYHQQYVGPGCTFAELPAELKEAAAHPEAVLRALLHGFKGLGVWGFRGLGFRVSGFRV